jgi:hypothetical protein
VPTQAARRELAAQGFHELSVVGRGVDSERFTPAARSDALRASWQAGPETPVLLAVGRIAAEKNVELALRAFEQARRDRPDLRMSSSATSGALASHRGASCRALRRRPARPHALSARTTPRPTRSSSPAPPTPSATSSWRRSPRACPWSPSTARRRPSMSPTRRERSPGRARRRGRFIAATASLASRRAPCSGMRNAAVAAARRASWDEVLARFEARLQDIVDAYQTSPAAVPVVA